MNEEHDALSDVADEAPAVDESPAEPAEAGSEADVDGPSVDVLEARLGEIEQAMTHLSNGSLDDAEAVIGALDQQIHEASD